MLNLFLQTGIFPNELQVTRVTPLFKDGENGEFENCRPISVQHITKPPTTTTDPPTGPLYIYIYIYIYICIYFQLYMFSIFREIYFQLGIYWNLLLFDMYLPGSTHFINLNFLILLGFFVVDVNQFFLTIENIDFKRRIK